jgi:nucleoside-diphosphate-sugar epimerase
MRIVLAGAHGQIARRLGRLLSARGDTVVGIIRNPAHESDVVGDGIDAVVLDLETASVEEVAGVLTGADAVVFAAGAGPNSGVERKHTVDHGAAVLLADAAERAAVRRYLLISSMGVEMARQGPPEGVDPVFAVYLEAKLRAEEEILPRPGLDTTVLRPGRLTDAPGTGRVTLARGLELADVPRDDVAAVLAELLRVRRSGEVLELVSGDTPIGDAVTALR